VPIKSQTTSSEKASDSTAELWADAETLAAKSRAPKTHNFFRIIPPKFFIFFDISL
jgi:hypothetical protein